MYLKIFRNSSHFLKTIVLKTIDFHHIPDFNFYLFLDFYRIVLKLKQKLWTQSIKRKLKSYCIYNLKNFRIYFFHREQPFLTSLFIQYFWFIYLLINILVLFLSHFLLNSNLLIKTKKNVCLISFLLQLLFWLLLLIKIYFYYH